MAETKKPYWAGKHYAFLQNRECEYFPCHKTDKPEDFNCLFCYCPLYALGDRCGGNFRYSEKGVKDCTNCLIPHVRGNFGRILEKYPLISALAARKTDGEETSGHQEETQGGTAD